MSRLDSERGLWIIPMPIDKTYKVITSKKRNAVSKEIFIMTGITEKEYHTIKHGSQIRIERGNCKFVVNSDDVLCFGEIDFHEGSEDCETLDTFNWLDDLVAKGISIPSRYNYDNHECVSPMKNHLWTETFTISTLCRYLHGCLGKPNLTLIFREIK